MSRPKRVNKTKDNLQRVWNQLDNASGELHNALDNISRMTDLPNDLLKLANRIDSSQIDDLRNKIEELIKEKEKEV